MPHNPHDHAPDHLGAVVGMLVFAAALGLLGLFFAGFIEEPEPLQAAPGGYEQLTLRHPLEVGYPH